MNMVEGMYWLGWAGAFVLFALAVYAAWRAWFGDRAAGRRRCPRCWYDLAYSTGMTCSECGHTAAAESEFTRTRRHWARGFVAILLAVTVVIAVRERALEGGWASAVPSRVLIALLPVFEDTNNDAVDQLIARMNRDQLTNGNLRRLIERCAAGDGRARPGSEVWLNKYGVLLNRFRPALAARRSAPDELSEIETTLLTIPPVVRLITREKWPAGAPARVGIRTLTWWPVGSDCRMTITPGFEGGEPATVFASGVNPPTTDYSFLTPPLTPEMTSLDFEITTARRTRELGDGWSPVATQRHSIPVKVVGKLASTLEPADESAMTSVMQQVMIGTRLWDGGPHPVRFYVRPALTNSEPFRGVAVGIVSEVLHDGEVVMVDHAWWLGGPNVQNRAFGSWSDQDPADVFRDRDLSTGEWTLHVYGDPDLALRAGGGTRYWAGEFTMPLPVERRPGNAPEPHWWYEGDDPR